MRGAIHMLLKNIIKQNCPLRGSGSWRAMSVSIPNSLEKNKHEKAGAVMNDNVVPLVAFSRPPPLPPVLGPLLVLSLLEMGSSNDGSDN